MALCTDVYSKYTPCVLKRPDCVSAKTSRTTLSPARTTAWCRSRLRGLFFMSVKNSLSAARVPAGPRSSTPGDDGLRLRQQNRYTPHATLAPRQCSDLHPRQCSLACHPHHPSGRQTYEQTSDERPVAAKER